MRLLATAPNYSAIIRPLQWLVVVLIWLFFLRVVRAVWVEVRPAGPRPRRAERRRMEREAAAIQNPPKGKLHLEVLEPEDFRGAEYDIEGELTVGRSPACGFPTTYDVYSSTMHARLFWKGRQLWVEDLGSTNGTFVNSERIVDAMRMGKGDLLQVGATVFEVVK